MLFKTTQEYTGIPKTLRKSIPVYFCVVFLGSKTSINNYARVYQYTSA